VSLILDLNDTTFLTLEIGEGNWTQVSLKTEKGIIILGAESLTSITHKILSAFQEYPIRKTVGKFDGLNVIWVLSLAEKHSSLYLARTSSRSILFFQNSEGKLIAKVDIAKATEKLLDTTPQAAPPTSWLRAECLS